MPRIRAIKHEYFTNDDIAQVSFAARLLGIGLTTLADREGRLEDRPLRIRAQVFPYDQVDCDALLTELETAQFIHRYSADISTGPKRFIQIRNFHKHQTPHFKERASVIPAPVDILCTSCESPPCIMGNGSTGNGDRVMGNEEVAPRQPLPRRITPELEPPFQSEDFINALATYKASRARGFKAESELLLYDDLREWGEQDSIVALRGAAKAGHLQVLHPDKYRNGNGNGKGFQTHSAGGKKGTGATGSEIDDSIWDRASYR